MTFAVMVAGGKHKVKVRSMVSGSETRAMPASPPRVATTANHRGDLRRAAGDDDDQAAQRSTAATTTSTSSTAPATTAKAPGPTAGEIQGDRLDSDEIRRCSRPAQPGTVIRVAGDGEYTFKPRLVRVRRPAHADAPVTLRGLLASMLRTKNASGDYGLHNHR